MAECHRRLGHVSNRQTIIPASKLSCDPSEVKCWANSWIPQPDDFSGAGGYFTRRCASALAANRLQPPNSME